MPPKTKAKPKQKGKGPLINSAKDAIGKLVSKALKAYLSRTKGKGKGK